MGAKKGLIFGSCPCGRWDFLRQWADWPDLVIAADGGLRLARAAGFVPDVYIGDGDSGGAAEPGLISIPLNPVKDVTDLEAAYDWAKEHGLTELVFTGCSGGRLDHHMAAMSLLETAARENVRAIFLDPDNCVEFLLPGSYELEPYGYQYFSLIPADRTLSGLTIRNAKYELTGHDVSRGSSLTVSNEFVNGSAALRFLDGCCWLIRSAPQ